MDPETTITMFLKDLIIHEYMFFKENTSRTVMMAKADGFKYETGLQLQESGLSKPASFKVKPLT